MAIVGIIANPSAGKDIRRLVAHASVFNNHEKVNIVRRVLLGLDAAGVDQVIIMPDSFAIGQKALEDVKLHLKTDFLEMPLTYSQSDSTHAAEIMRDRGASCIITLGGDGTNRAVAKGCGQAPLLPISTGTNNVFPQMIEGTIAGLAAGVVARGAVDTATTIRPTQRLEILRDGQVIDIALIDAVVYADLFIASRAVWDESKIRQIVLTQAEPHNIGLSSVGGNLNSFTLSTDQGLAIEVGGDTLQVLAPIAPGLFRWVNIAAYRPLNVGDSVAVEHGPAMLALDGERQIKVRPGEQIHIRLSADGPHVVDVRVALRAARDKGLFVQSARG